MNWRRGPMFDKYFVTFGAYNPNIPGTHWCVTFNPPGPAKAGFDNQANLVYSPFKWTEI